MNELLDVLSADLSESIQESQVDIDWDPPEERPSAPDTLVPYSNSRRSGPAARPAVIELHPRAQANFDEKAESLLTLLETAPAGPEGGPKPGEQASAEQVTARLPEHARPGETDLFRDGEGTAVSHAFLHAGAVVGLRGEGYRTLRRLAEEMQRTAALRAVVAVDTVESLIFRWVYARFTGRTSGAMSDVVLAEVAARVGEFEIVLPLFRVELAEPVRVGPVTLRTITAADFGRWEAVAPASETAESAATRRLLLLRERKRMQGFAAATLTVRGEPEHALSVGLKDAADAAAVLRLFSPAMLSPRARSFCTLWGREGLDAPAYLMSDRTRPRVVIGRFYETQQDPAWRLDAARVRLIREQALDALHHALFEGAPSGFAEEVRTALLLYSRSALRTAAIDKLLAILLPLESFLLRSGGESITENIATRLALATGETLEERKRIRAAAQAVYAMRSAYLHHGKAIEGLEQMDTLREFMRYAWRFFLGLGLHTASLYRERDEYLGALDDRRLAG